jgi:hypothetical protein
MHTLLNPIFIQEDSDRESVLRNGHLKVNKASGLGIYIQGDTKGVAMCFSNSCVNVSLSPGLCEFIKKRAINDIEFEKGAILMNQDDKTF